jgi:phosphoglycolate phosphatase-like HAD superfamily hydrolase
MTSAHPTSSRIRAVISDVDGTLLANDKLLADGARATVTALHAPGTRFVIMSKKGIVWQRPRGAAFRRPNDLTEAAADWLCRWTLAGEGQFAVRPSSGSTPCELYDALPSAHCGPSPYAGGSNDH